MAKKSQVEMLSKKLDSRHLPLKPTQTFAFEVFLSFSIWQKKMVRNPISLA